MLVANWENVLVSQTSFLGDTVLTLPLMSEVRRRFAVGKLTLLCQPASRELLQDHPAIDEIIVDDKKKLDRGVAGLRRKAAALAAQKFTLALTPHKSWRSALMLCWAGIPARVGFRQSRGWFLFHRTVYRDGARHDVERNLSLLEAFDIHPEQCAREISLPISPALQAAVDQKLAALGVDISEPIVGVHPGSVWPTKRWSAAGFAQLIEDLRRNSNCQVVLFGGAEDGAVVHEVLERCASGAINLAEQISLRELPAAIRRCRVFVTNDSGPMHIAVAERVPTVAVFCATTPALGFYPYSQHAVVVEKNLSCRPCTTHGGRRCPLGHQACSELIQPASVINAVEKFLRADRAMIETPLDSFQPEFIAV
jgi:heptosyltransferase-2